jgi:hypothetical protein
MAGLHRDRALELLRSGDADGWPDLYAAITAWGEGGARSEANQLLHLGRQLARSFPAGEPNILKQLEELEVWLDSLHVVPSLGEFAIALPPVAGVPA